MVQVLYADKDILVAVKPAGVESQAAKRFAPDMVSEIRKYLVIHKLCTCLLYTSYADRLAAGYGKRPVAEGLSFHAGRGEIVTLIGLSLIHISLAVHHTFPSLTALKSASSPLFPKSSSTVSSPPSTALL